MSDLDTIRWQLRAEAAEAEVVWHQSAVRGYAASLRSTEERLVALRDEVGRAIDWADTEEAEAEESGVEAERDDQLYWTGYSAGLWGVADQLRKIDLTDR